MTGWQSNSLLGLFVGTLLVSSAAAGDLNKDWNQFRGPNRDNLSRETGLENQWPEGGPELLQTITGIGEGYASVSLVGELMYTMGNVDGAEQVLALNRKTGEIVWKTRNGDEYHEGQGNGPRGTPTVVDGLVYSLGGNGDLSCLNADSGDVVWQMNILKEFGGGNITWGISESVLIDDGKVICSPGGSDATVVALNAKSGKVVWKSKVPEQPQASYASPVVATIGRVKQYVIFTSKGICGVRAKDGEPLWGQNASSNGTANCATPLVSGNYVFSSSDYGTGAELVELKLQGTKVQAKQVYFTKDMKNHHGGMVLLDGYVYGSNGDMLSCVNLKTGEPAWRERSKKGSVVYADGKIVFRNENGPVTLLAANSKEYKELGNFDQPDRSNRPAWSHPVIADGKLYLRDQDKLLVYNLK
ncbi:MAG TPA: PQQ-like beta-propeller repeat protein [Planctomycetaceae bacterium]|nr:PQQ-like beta-propeller repeat protein [Planctomycetaceae bacterium]HQZ65750.1 PQQ-like beta-propeller repeat protein [Planctomycetaceae bacterium]